MCQCTLCSITALACSKFILFSKHSLLCLDKNAEADELLAWYKIQVDYNELQQFKELHLLKKKNPTKISQKIKQKTLKIFVNEDR